MEIMEFTVRKPLFNQFFHLLTSQNYIVQRMRYSKQWESSPIYIHQRIVDFVEL